MSGSNNKTANAVNANPTTENNTLPAEWDQVAYFFEVMGEHGPADDLWQLLKLALIADDEENNSQMRANMIFVYEHTIAFFKNVYALLQQQQKK
ncbi:hypothetical protein [Ferruginibacter sp.]